MAVGFSKLGAALIAIFTFCLLILAADLAYVLWRRRRFRRRSASSAAGDSSVYALSSKELLYFFCWKNQSRIEPNDQVSNVGGPDCSRDRRDIDRSSAAIGDEEDGLKIHEEMYGPSRLLFTIKEEEEADQRSTDAQDRSDYDQETVDETTSESGDDDVAASDVVLSVDSDDEVTPFTTPCASPPYYTPSPSPSRDEAIKRAHESYGVSASREEFASVSLEIVGV